MRTLHFTVCFFLLALITGCSKSGDNTPAGYSITGLSDFAVRQYADTTITAVYHVHHPADLHEPVTFNIQDLPPGVTATPVIVTDTTSFSVQVSWHIHMTAAASFPVSITLYAASIGTKVFTFRINVSPSSPFTYALSPLHDIQVPLYADTMVRIPVTATYGSGIKETVSISADELPAGVTASPAAVSGIPSFTDTITFHISADAPGSFPVVIHASSSQGAITASFNVNIQAGAVCAPELADVYTGTTVCASYSGVGTGISPTYVKVIGTNKLQLLLPFATATAEVDCSSATFNVLPVTSGGLVFAGGAASFNANTIIVNYSLSGTINSACTTTLVR